MEFPIFSMLNLNEREKIVFISKSELGNALKLETFSNTDMIPNMWGILHLTSYDES